MRKNQSRVRVFVTYRKIDPLQKHRYKTIKNVLMLSLKNTQLCHQKVAKSPKTLLAGYWIIHLQYTASDDFMLPVSRNTEYNWMTHASKCSFVNLQSYSMTLLRELNFYKLSLLCRFSTYNSQFWFTNINVISPDN